MFTIGNRTLSIDSLGPPFIVAEIGNNHQGDLSIAKSLVEEAQRCGCDAVKFQKKDIETAFSQELLDSPYVGPNSFGKTYREHKEFLELSNEDFEELYEFCKKIGIFCFSTAFDMRSLEFLESIGNPIHKICSFHVTNHEMIHFACETKKPLILSSGMCRAEELDQAVWGIIGQKSGAWLDNFILLHCVSSYPAKNKDLNLNIIPYLRKRYACLVGYSGHEQVLSTCLSTIPLGTSMIERHFTFDRTWKGPDNAFSLNPPEMDLLVRWSKQIYEALGEPPKRLLDCELSTREKFLNE